MNTPFRHPLVEHPTESSPHSIEAVTPAPASRVGELSSDARRFLHDLHVAERQLNAAFNVGREGGELQQRIRRVYREMFGTD